MNQGLRQHKNTSELTTRKGMGEGRGTAESV
jgi:hypothetical protein